MNGGRPKFHHRDSCCDQNPGRPNCLVPPRAVGSEPERKRFRRKRKQRRLEELVSRIRFYFTLDQMNGPQRTQGSPRKPNMVFLCGPPCSLWLEVYEKPSEANRRCAPSSAKPAQSPAHQYGDALLFSGPQHG